MNLNDTFDSNRIRKSATLRIFLDYDGTLAEFAPTPDVIHVDSELIDLLGRLNSHQRFQLAVISGRRLSHVRALIPVPGILLGGTYGIEILEPSGKKLERLEFEKIRPKLEVIKLQWVDLVHPHGNFYLEDKGWSIALHAKYADQETTDLVFSKARLAIQQANLEASLFRILGGHKFLELAPQLANKGLTVRYLLSRYPLEGALPVYIGDDDKDEEAFEEIVKHSGIAIKVGPRSSDTVAQLNLDSPQMVRQFLESLLQG